MPAERRSEPQKKSEKSATTMDLSGERDIVFTRRFEAPARIVFDAWTKPELVSKWWAPKSMGNEMVSCEADLRVGGTYRYVIRSRRGEALAFSGTYREISPPTRLVYTHVFEPMQDQGFVVCTVTFTEKGGGTDVVSTEVYPSEEIRKIVLGTGMAEGVHEHMNQLAELLRTPG